MGAGKCVGAAAAALGCMLNGLHAQEASANQILDETLGAFQAALQNALRLSQSNSAKIGIAHGLAAVLGAPHMLPGVDDGDTRLLSHPEHAAHAKQALEVRFASSSCICTVSTNLLPAQCLFTVALLGSQTECLVRSASKY